MRISVGDTELAVEIAGEGPPLVWCHGLASCVDGDRDVVTALAEHFTVLAYDARGHGRSQPIHETSRYSYPILAGDLLGVLDAVGWARAIVAGASMGAATAARAACLAPDRVDALVMARPGAMGEGGRAPGWLQMLFAGGAHAIRAGGIDGAIAFLMSIPLAREQLVADPSRIETLRQDWGRHDPLSIAAALEAIPATGPLDGDLRADMIEARTLVIPGNDPIHPTADGFAVAAMIPGAVVAPPFDGRTRDDEIAGLVSLIRDFAGGRSGA